MGVAALLTQDESALGAAAVFAHERLVKVPGTQDSADFVFHQRSLLAGSPVRVDQHITTENMSSLDPMPVFVLLHLGREAIDAEEPSVAVAAVRSQPLETPLGRAVRAAIEAAAAGDEDRWHDAASASVEHGFRLLAVDALEGLGAAAAASESWVECLRLAAAAARLRDETGYRWHFAFEQRRLDAAIAAATEAVAPDVAGAATAEGGALEWREAVAYAGRARGQRQRPSHGWAALTPTELRVVALAAEGLTNPQIAERLLMGRATVKTHLDHVFTKTGLHSRTEVATEYARRGPSA